MSVLVFANQTNQFIVHDHKVTKKEINLNEQEEAEAKFRQCFSGAGRDWFKLFMSSS